MSVDCFQQRSIPRILCAHCFRELRGRHRSGRQTGMLLCDTVVELNGMNKTQTQSGGIGSLGYGWPRRL